MTEEFSADRYASDLLRAHDYRSPIALLSEVHPGATVDDAYLVQVSVLASMIGRNDPIIGAKVGVHQRRPVFSLYFRSALMGTFEVADLSQTIAALAQPVIVLRLFKDVSGTDVSEDEIRDATESVVAGIEIIDYRMAPRESLTHIDAVADNGGIAKILVGEHGIDISHRTAALDSLVCQFLVDGVETGPPVDRITAPLAAVTALANHLGSQGGKLEAGWSVVVGPLCAPAPLSVGTKVEFSVNNMAPVRLRAR